MVEITPREKEVTAAEVVIARPEGVEMAGKEAMGPKAGARAAKAAMVLTGMAAKAGMVLPKNRQGD
jgi:hypothetical protein